MFLQARFFEYILNNKMLKMKKIEEEKKRNHSLFSKNHGVLILETAGGGGGTFGISGWGCATGTLEPLTCTRASSAEFCYPILE